MYYAVLEDPSCQVAAPVSGFRGSQLLTVRLTPALVNAGKMGAVE
jgi:hypothetical protein